MHLTGTCGRVMVPPAAAKAMVIAMHQLVFGGGA